MGWVGNSERGLKCGVGDGGSLRNLFINILK